MTLLSKSNYIKGLQCYKLLWFSINQRDAFPPVSSAQQHLFDEGTLLGELAKKLYPKGIECYQRSNEDNIKFTKDALKKKKPLFEAGLSFNNAHARVDILVPSKGGWDIIEVKSGTKVKDEHIIDVSYQYYIFSNAGIKINNCYVMHFNSEYVRKGKINLKKLLVMEKIDVTLDGISENVIKMIKVIEGKVPKVDIGSYCDDPYECALKEICWKHIPKSSVFELGGAKKCWELYSQGIVLIKDIPSDVKLTSKMQIQLECVKSGKPHIEKEAIKNFLKTLNYPLHYFDFETFSSGVPMYNGLKPYQQVPFQYSLHIVDKTTTHYSYLCLQDKDPRLELLENLKKQIKPKGSIIAYYAIFEIGRLRELGKAFPKYKKWIESLIPRFVDLLDVFKNFQCYYPSQGSSASLKKVLPAFTGKDYSEMEIGNGSDATLAYLSVVKGLISEKSVRADLERYCGQDTEGMKWIIERLEKTI